MDVLGGIVHYRKPIGCQFGYKAHMKVDFGYILIHMGTTSGFNCPLPYPRMPHKSIGGQRGAIRYPWVVGVQKVRVGRYWIRLGCLKVSVGWAFSMDGLVLGGHSQ